MSPTIEELFTQLEALSEELVAMTEFSISGADNLAEIQERIAQRGLLIKHLSELLSKNEPRPYTERNRLTMIHNQGQHIEKNLANKRQGILNGLASNTQVSAFLNRITGVVQTAREQNSIDV